MRCLVGSLQDLENEGHKKLYAYWDDKRGGRKAPSRKDIDPIELRDLLPHMFMFDVIRNPIDFKMRLHGTHLVDVMGRDNTGDYFSKMYRGTEADELWDIYCEVANSFSVIYSKQSASWMSKDFVHYERLLLPLSEDGDEVNILLGLSYFIAI
ncbi:PAS domain-containing protein [Curvivirga aplysinae]|uniref:PAS domain-containing protein n=1 Tax=Curvivirga aplysinae TaxID=2529852 RepID=UPI0012BD1B80|nr:PAS domain-containing protein [Curvivirga aplysinae]MTI10797.1 PAS domain-containing protein [Curvivirga aplysinae]